jgi:hypothetical protein
MTSDQLNAAARTVVQTAEYLEQLKADALAIFGPEAVAARGYITPSEELCLRQLQVSYWQTRNALLELVNELRRDVDRFDTASPEQFLIALAAAALLVDAARFLRVTFHHVTVVRRKLDEPDAVYGIPPRTYDDVQRSLVSAHNAWHLWQATRYYDKNCAAFATSAAAAGLEPIVAIIDRLRDRLRPSVWTYLRTWFRVRGRRAVRRVGRDLLGRGIYDLQQAVSCRMADLTVRRGHLPALPSSIRDQVASLLRPGDVLVVRKEYAATNYFLPGYWPHAALYVGTIDDLDRLGIADLQHVAPRLPKLAELAPSPCALEALKDGVRIRSLDSPLASDSVVVVRPLVDEASVAAALAQAFMHEGKPYDFDFDFCSSHRLVCTEVVYRAYEGVADVQFDLARHVGRFALAAGDLLRMALAKQHFEVVACYSPAHSAALEFGPAAEQIVRGVEGPLPVPGFVG